MPDLQGVAYHVQFGLRGETYVSVCVLEPLLWQESWRVLWVWWGWPLTNPHCSGHFWTCAPPVG